MFKYPNWTILHYSIVLGLLNDYISCARTKLYQLCVGPNANLQLTVPTGVRTPLHFNWLSYRRLWTYTQSFFYIWGSKSIMARETMCSTLNNAVGRSETKQNVIDTQFWYRMHHERFDCWCGTSTGKFGLILPCRPDGLVFGFIWICIFLDCDVSV